MNEPPDQTAVFSAANLLSFDGMIVPKYSLHELLVLAQPRVHVEEEHPLLGQLLLQLVVDDLRLVLGADTGEVLLLRLRDPELVPGVLDLGRQVLPRVRLLLGRPDVVVDVVEVDPRHITAPTRQRTREEVVERPVAHLPHPARLVLVLSDRLDHLVRDTPTRLEEVVLRLVRIRETVLPLVVGADLLNNLGLGQCHHKPPRLPNVIRTRKVSVSLPARTRRSVASVRGWPSDATSEYLPAHHQSFRTEKSWPCESNPVCLSPSSRAPEDASMSFGPRPAP